MTKMNLVKCITDAKAETRNALQTMYDALNQGQQGDKVSYNGKVWVSDIDGNVWEPGVYGWSEVI